MRESLEPQLKRVLWLFLFVPPPHSKLGFLGGSVKNSLAMRETWVRSLEEGTATHSSILAWRIPWRSLASMGSQRVGHNWATKHSSLRVKWTRLQQNRLEKLEWLRRDWYLFPFRFVDPPCIYLCEQEDRDLGRNNWRKWAKVYSYSLAWQGSFYGVHPCW